MAAPERHEMALSSGPFCILHINSACTWRGGEQQTLWLCQGLQRRGHRIVLACPPGSPLMDRARQAGLFVCPVKMRGEWDLWAVRELMGIVNRHGIEMVHCHTAHAHTLGLLAAQFSSVSYRFLTRRVDFHIGRHPLNRWKYGPALTAILAISEGIRRVLMEDGIAPQRVITVPSGIDLEQIREVGDPSVLRREFGIPPGALVVGIVAALAPHKDHRTFLEAAAKVKKTHPAVRFLIVGEGELESQLKNLCRTLGLSHEVIFTGFREDAIDLIGLFDIFVLSSYLEGMGTSLLDAMALGKPVVATRIGGIPEVVLEGRNGFLVPTEQPAELAQAIERLGNDPELRHKMGAFGREHVRSFNVERTIERTEQVYARCARGSAASPLHHRHTHHPA
jgi:glycosyltransferase involved in cell wall biosynthesis